MNTNYSYPGQVEPSQAPMQPQPVTVRLPQVRPVVTYVLVGFTVLIYLLQLGSQTLLGLDYPAALGMKSNAAIAAGQLWRLITPMFLHGSVVHIGFNMYALYLFGSTLERYYGHLRFTMLYFVAGLAGNVASFALSSAASLGASTAVFGLVAAEGIFILRNRFLFGRRAMQALLNIVVIVVINLILGLSPGIDNWGHVGGLLGGFVFAWLAGPVLQVSGVPPIMALEDRSSTTTAWLVVMVEAAILGAAAIGIIFLRG